MTSYYLELNCFFYRARATGRGGGPDSDKLPKVKSSSSTQKRGGLTQFKPHEAFKAMAHHKNSNPILLHPWDQCFERSVFFFPGPYFPSSIDTSRWRRGSLMRQLFPLIKTHGKNKHTLIFSIWKLFGPANYFPSHSPREISTTRTASFQLFHGSFPIFFRNNLETLHCTTKISNNKQ